MERRILFGLGATKAGTSWLYSWLQAHPECAFRHEKELHVWDAVDGGRVEKRVGELRAARQALEAKGGRAERIRDLEELEALMAEGPDGRGYTRYLAARAGGAELVGDITPAYGLLPEARLSMLAGLGETRFLYILRDPVARLWSHVRMIAGRREPSGAVTEERAARILKRVLRGDEPEIAVRSDYRGALQRISAAVPEARRLFVFFEELFTGEAQRRICAFLGIGYMPGPQAVVHGGQPLEMTAAQRAAARDWLSEQYDDAARVMGRLPGAWRETERV